MGRQPPPPRASFVPLKSKKQRQWQSSAVFIHVYTYTVFIYFFFQLRFKLAVASRFLVAQQACALLSPSPSQPRILSPPPGSFTSFTLTLIAKFTTFPRPYVNFMLNVATLTSKRPRTSNSAAILFRTCRGQPQRMSLPAAAVGVAVVVGDT